MQGSVPPAGPAGDATASSAGGTVPPADAPVPGLYRHHKGGTYRVLCVGRHSESEEWLVTYWSEATRDWWVRPLALWSAPAGGVARFVRVDAVSPA